MVAFDFTYHDDNRMVIDLGPFVTRQLERINIEVDRRVAHKIAAELRKLGWTCIPPVQ